MNKKKNGVSVKIQNKNSFMENIPLIAEASVTPTRRNRAGSIERTDRFKNIDDGVIPFNKDNVYADSSSMNVRDTVELCQRAYYNFPVFRNIIDLMTEFSVSNIFYRGGNKKSRDFFEALFSKINLWDFQDKFYREYYRSGNVFIYKFETELNPQEIARITQVFGESQSQKSKKFNSNKIPSRYIILNPADIQMVSQLTFNSGSYFKSLSNYELETLRNPRTEEDKEIFDSLPESVQKQIKESNKTGASVIRVPLGKEKMLAVFYKKQDYEPFAIPMGFPVLEDINYKQELKKMDMAISRTMQQAILLITMGAKEEEGGINQKAMTAMQELFKHETVGRVLIADYTTKAEFIVPKISELLDPKKYEVVDRDINIGLNNILVGGEKFSNQSSKVEVFLGRLRQGRESFINNFLLPEIKNIAKSLGFKSFPTPYYEDFSLKDDSNSQRIYTRLVELGVLTPQEGLTAIETGRLPDKESSLVSQRENMDFREEGLYQPLIGAPIQEPKGDAEEQDVKDPNSSKTKVKISKTSGRPNGTSGIKQSTKKISPIGASYSCAKIRDNLIQYSKLYAEVESELKRIFNLKEFNDAQKETAEEITRTIILNEESDKWTQSVAAYVKNPKDNNPERLKKAMEIGSKHGLDLFLSSILMESEI